MKPIRNNAIVKVHNKVKETKSGLQIVSNEVYNTELYEIVALPDELKDQYKDLKVGDLFYAWKNWRGFKVGKTEDNEDLFVIDFPDIACIIENF